MEILTKEKAKEGIEVSVINIVGYKNNSSRTLTIPNEKGIIKRILPSRRLPVLVEFYKNIGGHSGNSIDFKGKAGHCWWCRYDELMIVNQIKVNLNWISNND